MKLFICLLVFVAVVAFSTSGGCELLAQGKKGSAKQGIIELVKSRQEHGKQRVA